jgi:hypothetical protein
MMKAKLMMSGLMASLLAVAGVAYAAPGNRDAGVNHRQFNQQSRIQQGVRQGDLSRGEARHLEREQGHIAREEQRYRADGHLSRWERADLRHDQNRASRDIWRERHDGDRFGWRHDGNRFGERHDGRFDQRGPGYGDAGRYGRFEHGWSGPHASVDRREFDQRYRIEQGVRSGQLTRNEAHNLMSEQRDIRQEERQYRSDGMLTRNERRDLQQDLNQASRNIYNETHDADRRF